MLSVENKYQMALWFQDSTVYSGRPTSAPTHLPICPASTLHMHE